jgi:hypothetical protein
MSKKNKSGVLNQIIEEPEEVTQEVAEKESLVIDPEVLETKLIAFEEVVAQEEFLDEVPELDDEPSVEELPVEELPIEELPLEEVKSEGQVFDDVKKIIEAPERTIESLTRGELRDFQRTGILPK